jgi:hypothetical protein
MQLVKWLSAADLAGNGLSVLVLLGGIAPFSACKEIGPIHFHFDLAEFAVVLRIRRVITDAILAGQFFSYFLEGAIQAIHSLCINDRSPAIL